MFTDFHPPCPSCKHRKQDEADRIPFSSTQLAAAPQPASVAITPQQFGNPLLSVSTSRVLEQPPAGLTGEGDPDERSDDDSSSSSSDGGASSLTSSQYRALLGLPQSRSNASCANKDDTDSRCKDLCVNSNSKCDDGDQRSSDKPDSGSTDANSVAVELRREVFRSIQNARVFDDQTPDPSSSSDDGSGVSDFFKGLSSSSSSYPTGVGHVPSVLRGKHFDTGSGSESDELPTLTRESSLRLKSCTSRCLLNSTDASVRRPNFSQHPQGMHAYPYGEEYPTMV